MHQKIFAEAIRINILEMWFLEFRQNSKFRRTLTGPKFCPSTAFIRCPADSTSQRENKIEFRVSN